MTVAEACKQAGMTDEQIAALDAKAVAGFESVLTTAQQDREAAELAQRSTNAYFDEKIAPALTNWGVEQTNLTAQRDYYKTLAEKAKDGGFIAEAPPFQQQQTRNPDGTFVANANQVPGSPADVKQLEAKIGSAFGNLADLQWRYRSLNDGKEMPDSPTKLGAEADAQRMTLSDYVAKKYDFAGRESALQAERQKAHDDAIRKEATEAVERKYAEQGGSNPNVRQAAVSQYSEVRKAVAEGKRPDPLTMTREQRHAATAQAIRQDIAATIQ